MSITPLPMSVLNSWGYFFEGAKNFALKTPQVRTSVSNDRLQMWLLEEAIVVRRMT